MKLLEILSIKDPYAEEAQVFVGKEEMKQKYEDYERRYDDYEFSGHGILREETYGAFDVKTKKHMLIVEKGRYSWNPAELIFQSKFIPYNARRVIKNDLFDYILDFYNATIEKINLKSAEAKKDGKKLYVLLGTVSTTAHIAIDWDTKENIYLYGFKTYRYYIYSSAKYPATSSETIRENNVFVYLLDEKFENLFELNTNRFWQKHKSATDIWEPRAPKIPDKIVCDYLRSGKLSNIDADTYVTAVKMLNMSRAENLGRDGDFAYLEESVANIEDAIQKGKNPAFVRFEGDRLIEAILRFERYPICK